MILIKDWLVSFLKVFFVPIPKTFIEESQKAKGKFASATIFLVLITAYLLWFVHYFYEIQILAFSALAVLLFFPIIFLFYTFCIHFVYQRVFHRKKYIYDEILYLIVCVLIPFSVVNSVVGLIPEIGNVASGVSYIYPAFLITSIIHSICKLKVWELLVTFALATILGTAGFFCIPAFILSLMGSVPKSSEQRGKIEI